MTPSVIHAALCLSASLVGLFAGPASAAAAEPREGAAEAKPPTVRLYLCTQTDAYALPWMKRNNPPRGYVPWRSAASSWIEIYLPDHKLATPLGFEGFFPATDDRYKNRPARGPTPRYQLVRPTLRSQPLPQLTLTDDARTGLMGKLRAHLEANAKGK